ncbi:MAG: integrase arm-type DNA-binding domain-containing protein [Comamonas sp.]
MPNFYPLSDTAIRGVKPGDSRKRLTDGKGLYLLLFVKGGAHGWRLDYAIHGRRKTLSLGTYPETSLRQAREKADEARRLVATGTDPSDTRKAIKAEAQQERQAEELIASGHALPGSFEAVAKEWFEVRRSDWSDSYGSKVMRRLEVDIFPWLGHRPVGGISPADVLAVLRRVELRGVLDTAHRARENCGQVFRYAVATGQAKSDPTRDLKDALRKPLVRHMAAITEPARLAELLRAIDGYSGSLVVCTALRLAPMLMVRPGELRFAEWTEIDLDTATWAIPAQRMKREKAGKLHGSPHLVPLPRQAVDLLRGLHALTGRNLYVFRGERAYDRAMSENTINAALRRMGYSTKEDITGHGFRATARTILDERLGFDRAAIEAQLAHSVKDQNGRAYNRTEFVEQRRTMLQAWADYLDTLRLGNVLPLRAHSG